MQTEVTEPRPYDRDYYAWLTESAALLRDGRVADLDLEQLAEELEDMGRSERRAVESYTEQL